MFVKILYKLLELSFLGGASITLRRNGHVEIEGDLFINGAMYVPPVS